MKWIICAIIKTYWHLIPAYRRKHCLFKENCSSHVYRVTVEQGALKGFKAFLLRWRQCRPDYHIMPASSDKELVIKLADGSLISADQFSSDTLYPELPAAFKLERMLNLNNERILKSR